MKRYALTIEVLLQYRSRLERGGDLRKEMTAEDAEALWLDIGESVRALEEPRLADYEGRMTEPIRLDNSIR